MRPEWQPIHNPIANLVYCAHDRCADVVTVDGKVFMRDGKMLTMNEQYLIEEARDRASSLAQYTRLEDLAKHT